MPAIGDQHRGGQACTVEMTSNDAETVQVNPFEEHPRHMNEYTAREIATLQARLDKKLGPEYISSRPGASGQKVHYLSADKCINLANEVFGFNGWSSSIQNIQIDFVEENQNSGRISLGLSVIVKVSLKDGTYHEDIGYGHTENCKGKAAAFEKAKKEGTTDALKRSLRNFGNVLGNCIYDKDYVSKVTKVKAAPARWDVDDLHRHPDFVPIKKELVQPKPSEEDDDLPPPRVNANKDDSGGGGGAAAFDGDGEFGSDLFDEADFVVPSPGNPDEVTVEPEILKKPSSTITHGQTTQQTTQPNISHPPGKPNLALSTPSKPERSMISAPAPRQFNQIPQNTSSASTSDGRTNPPTAPGQYAGQRRAVPGPLPPQNCQNNRAAVNLNGNRTENNETKDIHSPGASPSMNNQRQSGTPAAFFSAKAVDMLRDNPSVAPTVAPHFDPHAESPSIRKTAGFDHSKSVPISKPMLAGASPAPNHTRDFINPSADVHRKIGASGAAGASGVGSPLNRGQTAFSYRPLTRPNIDPRNVTAPNRASLGIGPQSNNSNNSINNNGKRHPLGDVTNATSGQGGSGNHFATDTGIGDPKRQRLYANNGNLSGLPQRAQN